MPRPGPLLAVVLSAQFVIPLSISGTAVALPEIAVSLDSEAAALQWVVNGFNVAFAVCTIVWGALSDCIGYTRAFRLGVVTAASGGIISACAPNLAVLDAGRVIAGIGSAAVLTGAAPIITRAFDGAARARAFALFGTVNGLGLAAGPAVSGLIVAGWGWRGIFAVHTVVLLAALLGSARLPDLGRGHSGLRQLLDFRVFTSPRFVAMALVPVAGAIGFVTFLTYLPGALGAIHGLSAASTGVIMLLMTIPVLLAPALVHRLLARGLVTPVWVITVSFGCLLAGGAGVLMLLRPDLPVAAGVAPMILLGVGFGLPLGFVDAQALAAVPADRAGSASGVINLLRIGSEALFVAVYAAILSAVVTGRLPGPAGELIASGLPGQPWIYRSGLLAAGGVMLVLVGLAALTFVLLARAGRRDEVRARRASGCCPGCSA